MKKIIVLVFIFLNTFIFAQNYDTKAEFPGGENAFQKEFMRMVHSYVDTNIYAVNGKFTFIIEVDEAEKMSNMKVYPRVRNYEEFLEDMTFAMKKIKKKWKPATKDGEPILYNHIFEINFTTDYADHGD